MFRAIVLTIATVIMSQVTSANELPEYACHDYPGAQFYCASQCYPNCQAQFDSYYSVMMILPNKAECFLNHENYGSFRAFFPTTAVVEATSHNYYTFNGECYKNETNSTDIAPGTVYDGYFSCDSEVVVKVGGGNQPTATITNDQWERRIVVYTQTKLDICKAEFPKLFAAPEALGASHLTTGLASVFMILVASLTFI